MSPYLIFAIIIAPVIVDYLLYRQQISLTKRYETKGSRQPDYVENLALFKVLVKRHKDILKVHLILAILIGVSYGVFLIFN